MGEVWHPKDSKILREWLDTIILEASDDLSDWESKFVSNMEERLTLGFKLTQVQEEKLEQIYAAKTK
jgi:hypothetical protein